MSESAESPSGAEVAAVLLLALGEQEAAEVLKHMEPKEVQAVGSAMTSLGNVTQDTIGSALERFIDSVGNQSSLGLGSDEYLKNVLRKALGKDMADSVLPAIMMGNDSQGLDTLKWMEPDAIASLLSNEHPQLIAIVLASMESELAGEVLCLLPEATQKEVVTRIATLDGVRPNALRELDELMESSFSRAGNLSPAKIGGPKTAAGILNFVSPDVEAHIIEHLSEALPELSEQIVERMFTFDNLLEIDDRGLQALLRETPSDLLPLALRGVSPAASAKVFNNMSSRAAELLKDDMQAKGPVRLSEVEQAQKAIIETARKLAEEEKIALPSKGEALV